MLGGPSRRARHRLEERGRRAWATVLELTGRPMELNHRGSATSANASEWVQRVRIRVEPDDEPAFEHETRLRFPFSSPPKPNKRIAVLYDPGDHETMVWTDVPPKEGAEGPRAAGAPMSDGERLLASRLRAEGRSVDEIVQAIAVARRSGSA